MRRPDAQTPVASPGFARVRAASISLRAERTSPQLFQGCLSLMLTAVPTHVLSALSVPGAGHLLPLGILPVEERKPGIITPILQKRELRLREGKLAQEGNQVKERAGVLSPSWPDSNHLTARRQASPGVQYGKRQDQG